MLRKRWGAVESGTGDRVEREAGDEVTREIQNMYRGSVRMYRTYGRIYESQTVVKGRTRNARSVKRRRDRGARMRG